VGKENFHHLWPRDKSLWLPLAKSTIALLGKNPSDAHVTATVVIMRFSGSKYDNLQNIGYLQIFQKRDIF